MWQKINSDENYDKLLARLDLKFLAGNTYLKKNSNVEPGVLEDNMFLNQCFSQIVRLLNITPTYVQSHL